MRPPRVRLPKSAASHRQAPQSHIPPPLPPSERSFDERRAEVYRRRVTRPDLPDGPPPTPFQRGIQLAGGVLSAVAGVYMTLWMDFGEKEHCFSPVSGRWSAVVRLCKWGGPGLTEYRRA